MDKPWERIGCLIDASYMPPRCFISYKVRDIYEATRTHMQKIICFGTICESIVHLVAIIRNKTSIMDLSGPVDFEGKLDHIPTW